MSTPVFLVCDLFRAALAGALARAYGAVTFTEIFCADRTGDSLFFTRGRDQSGGTHYCALVLGERAEGIAAFGRMLGLEVVCLE
ncbi:hypothetical protein OAS39_04700 [Pirellulales bacterium]|nr:hypothetical protein [Pirellulales bacterium]